MSATGTVTRAETACPNCGATAERGQLVCLECGARIALGKRTPRRRRRVALAKPSRALAALRVAIVALAIVAAAVACGFALRQIAGEREPASPAAAGQPTASEAREDASLGEGPIESARNTTGRKAPRKPSRPPAKSSGPGEAGGIQTWPDEDAFTVVLLSDPDKARARAYAERLVRDGSDAGLLRSNDYPSLERGFWVVFSGRYPTRQKAQQAATRWRARVGGGFPQLVRRRR